MGTMFYLSSLPGSSLGQVPMDKLLHGIEYAALGAALARALAGGVARVDRGAALAAWGLATVYGASDELHQSLVPGREMSGFDLAADATGALAAVTVLLWLSRRT